MRKAGITAACVLGAILGIGLIIFTVIVFVFSGPLKKTRNRFLSAILRFILRFYCRICLPAFGICSVKVNNGCNFHKTDVKIYIANHRSFIDPFLILSETPNTCVLLKKKYASGIAAWYLSEFFDFAVIDKSSRTSLKNASDWGMSKLKEGRNILIFPEGARSTTERMLPFNSLAFRLSKITKTAIVPIAISSDFPFLAKSKTPALPDCKANFKIDIMPPVSPSDLSAEEMLVCCERTILKKLSDQKKEFLNGQGVY